MKSEKLNKKRLVIRVILLILVVAVGFGLFYIGKEHDVLIDNKNAEIDGKSYKAAEYMRVVVDGDEENYIELYANDRDAVKVQGPSHTFKVTVMDENTEEVLKSAELSLNFGTESMLMLSLPALAEGAPSVYLPLPSE